MEKETIITVKETSKLLKCSKKQVYRLCKERRIKSFKLGSGIRIYKETVTEDNINSIRPNF